MTTTVDIEQVPINTTSDLTRAREVVDTARGDAHTALVAHTRLLTIETLTSQIAAVETQVHTDRNEWSQWVQRAVETSQDVANEQDWCDVFDAAMERLGLPRRQPPDRDIEWHTTVTLSGEVDDDDVRRLVRNEVGYCESIEVSQSAVVTVEVRVEGTREGPDGSCICDQIDTEDITANLPDWASDWDIEDEGTIYCEHD